MNRHPEFLGATYQMIPHETEQLWDALATAVLAHFDTSASRSGEFLHGFAEADVDPAFVFGHQLPHGEGLVEQQEPHPRFRLF
jgi:hypothetical protein